MIYLHSEHYEFERKIELGLYGDEIAAQKVLAKYCAENSPLVNAQDLISEKIVNKRIIGSREWPEGFSVSE